MLYDIIVELSQELGRDLNDLKQRDWLLRQINSAAREIYDAEDIRGCEREQVFNIGLTDQQIALPSHVGNIIAARKYEGRSDIQLVDMRPRYSRSGWKKPFLQRPYFQWRVKGDSALSTSLSDEAAITVSLPEGVVAEEAFSVYITGSSEQSAKQTEAVDFHVGDSTKNTIKFFSNISNIQKSKPTTYDLVIKDVGGIKISSIPSNQIIAKFTLVQILDRQEETSVSDQLVEVLFKARFEPFVTDYDVFTAGEIYEKAIYWKSLEHIFAKMDGKEEKAAMCGLKAHGLVSNIIANFASQLELAIDFGRNSTIEAFSSLEYGTVLENRTPYLC